MILNITLKAVVNGRDTGIEYIGKTNGHNVRFTPKYYEKQYSQVLDYAEKNNITTREEIKSGCANFDFWFEDKSGHKFVYDYYSSCGSNLDKGYFITDRKVCDIDQLCKKYHLEYK